MMRYRCGVGVNCGEAVGSWMMFVITKYRFDCTIKGWVSHLREGRNEAIEPDERTEVTLPRISTCAVCDTVEFRFCLCNNRFIELMEQFGLMANQIDMVLYICTIAANKIDTDTLKG
ncbi:MAG: hypothetical protein KDJ65_01365 [Anaerolineae bacterium]|nr:hypothetical protein [Anaerolineae bacterium]